MYIAPIVAGSLAALALSSGVAVATHTSGPGPEHDFVYGTGHVSQAAGFFEFDLHVNAMSGPLGEDAQGQWFFKRPEQEFFGSPLAELNLSGSVTCLSVAGNMARVRGLVETSTNPVVEGQGFEMMFTDSGAPGGDGDSVLTAAFLPPAAVNTCPPPTPSALVTESGNYIVHDSF